MVVTKTKRLREYAERKLGKRPVVVSPRELKPWNAPPEGDLKQEHMCYSMNLHPSSPNLRKERGSVGMYSSSLELSDGKKTLIASMSYHGAIDKIELPHEDLQRLGQFVQKIPKADGSERHAYPIYYADPKDPEVARLIQVGKMAFSENKYGKHVDIVVPDSMFLEINNSLFNKYLLQSAKLLATIHTDIDPEAKAKLMRSKRKNPGKDERHDRTVADGMARTLQVIRDVGPAALLHPRDLTPEERSAKRESLEKMLPLVDEGMRDETLRAIGSVLLKNLSPNSVDPAKSAENLVKFLDQALEGRGPPGVRPFTAKELQEILSEFHSMRQKRWKGP